MSDQRVVVIGSGPAGAMAAWQLISNGIPVTLLESGTRGPKGLLLRMMGQNVLRKKEEGFFGSDARDYHSSPNPRTTWFLNLALGGLSNNWTGAVPRFAPEDFFDGRRLHDKYVWPLEYENLVPYYERTEKLMGIVASGNSFPTLPAGWADHRLELPEPWHEVAVVAARMGHGLTTLPLADGAPWLLTRQGTAFNSYASIVAPLARSPLFEMITGAHVERLEWSEDKNRVTRVVYRDRQTKQTHELSASAFVVAAGAVASTRLLLNSTCGRFPNGLGNDRDLLGRYLHDHTREWWAFAMDKELPRLKPSAYMTRGDYKAAEPLMATSWTIGSTNLKEKVLGLLPTATKTFGVQVFGTMIPTENDRVTLHPKDKDPEGLPRASIDLTFNDAAHELIAGARQRLFDVMDAAGYHCSLTELEPEQVAPGSAVHYGGCARMHESSEFGVVDGYNRVYGAPNVLVVDAACFTTSPEKNPTLTAMALAARAADQLSQDLRSAS